jgi:hypothetical protein
VIHVCHASRPFPPVMNLHWWSPSPTGIVGLAGDYSVDGSEREVSRAGTALFPFLKRSWGNLQLHRCFRLRKVISLSPGIEPILPIPNGRPTLLSPIFPRSRLLFGRLPLARLPYSAAHRCLLLPEAIWDDDIRDPRMSGFSPLCQLVVVAWLLRAIQSEMHSF